MCGASHIQLAAAGARSFFCRFRSTRIEREARANVFKGALMAQTIGRPTSYRLDGCRPRADDHGVIILVSKNRPSLSARAISLFVVSHQ
jgi:hypothetical protein